MDIRQLIFKEALVECIKDYKKERNNAIPYVYLSKINTEFYSMKLDRLSPYEIDTFYKECDKANLLTKGNKNLFARFRLY